jgi:hypothetical protein
VPRVPLAFPIIHKFPTCAPLEVQARAACSGADGDMSDRAPQDALYMSWPNMLANRGFEVLLFCVND